jgi:negative regulator of flagellin synthesis FlgM
MAQQIQSIQSKIGADSVFDADKVNEIKSAIANGEFKVDSEKVADGLIQSVKDLLSNKT